MKGKFALGCGALALVGLLVAIVGGIALAGGYNRLVPLKQDVDGKWADVQNQYQRRADLIPNLVQTVEGAAKFEKSTMVEVTQARASVGQVKIDPSQAPSDPDELRKYEQAQAALGGALSRLLAVSEAYPDLKANVNFQNLQAQLEGTENRITTARTRFNESAQAYNTARQTFPTVLYASIVGFTPRPYFESKPGSDTPPPVKFDFDQKPKS